MRGYTGNENNAQKYQRGKRKNDGCGTAEKACTLFRSKQISRLANFIHSLTPQRSGLREMIRPYRPVFSLMVLISAIGSSKRLKNEAGKSAVYKSYGHACAIASEFV